MSINQFVDGNGRNQSFVVHWLSSTLPHDRMVRVVLGIILLIGAFLKGHELVTTPTSELDLFSARWLLVGLVEFELLAGLWMLSGVKPRPTHVAAILGFIAFAGVSCFKGLSGATSCGCFGRVPMNPWITFTFDLGAVAALVQFRPNQLQSYGDLVQPRYFAIRDSSIRFLLVLVTWFVLGLPAGFVMANFHPAHLSPENDLGDDNHVIVLEPETWTGKQFPLARYIDIGADLTHGEWIVLLYHHGCPKCQEVLPVYIERAEAMRASSALRRIALIELPPFSDSSFSETTHCRHGRLNSAKKWFVSTPSEILVRHGIVAGQGASILLNNGNALMQAKVNQRN